MNFFSSLSPAERQAFAEVAWERTFARGATIMAEGEQGNYVMVILSGWTQVTVHDRDGERVVAERGPGQLVGERGALRVNVRSATVIALDTVRALVMKTEDFASFVGSHPRVLDIVENQIYDRLTEDPGGYGQEGWPVGFPGRPVGQASGDGRRPRPPAGENCTVLLTDVVEFGALHRNDRDRHIIRREGLAMMRGILGSRWEQCISEDRGDGLLIVVPPMIPTTRIVASLHRELPVRLRQHNHTYAEPTRIRLRIAVNVGPVTADPLGMSGEAIIRTARLVEAPPLKAAMKATGFSLGMIVSAFVYETAVEQGDESVDPGEYQMVDVRLKEFNAPAWMRLVDLSPPAGREPLARRAVGQPEPRSAAAGRRRHDRSRGTGTGGLVLQNAESCCAQDGQASRPSAS